MWRRSVEANLIKSLKEKDFRFRKKWSGGIVMKEMCKQKEISFRKDYEVWGGVSVMKEI